MMYVGRLNGLMSRTCVLQEAAVTSNKWTTVDAQVGGNFPFPIRLTGKIEYIFPAGDFRRRNIIVTGQFAFFSCITREKLV